MILVTGVSGALGSLVHRRLAEDGAPVLAGSRTPPDGGRTVDFDDPAALAEAFAGVDVLLLVSAGYADDDVVIARHGAAIEAAVRAGVRHVVYTSIAGSGERMTLAVPHRWTERALAAAPLGWTVLRNGLYAEFAGTLAGLGAELAAAEGVFRLPWGPGTLPVVSREDLADAAARVAREVQGAIDAGRPVPHAGRTYELEGEAVVGGADLAGVLAEVLGRPVRYEPSPLRETWAVWEALGADPYQRGHAVSLHSNIAAGFAVAAASDLPGLLPGRPRAARALIASTVRAAVAAGG
ncbi:NAD(P)H-binding protein [Kitasatospora sp. NPDC097643]|uniref:NAD(P)H-binding protein n=1 Tax=Kitasatospora sp. NPDC097643 TaxID=3157230 RepID=UPI00331695DD